MMVNPPTLQIWGKKHWHRPCQRVHFAIPYCAAHLASFAISIAAKKMDDL